MCDAVSSKTFLLPYSITVSPNSKFGSCSCISAIGCTLRISTPRDGGSQFTRACFGSNEADANSAKSTNSMETSRNSIQTAFSGELELKERGKQQIDLKRGKEKLKSENRVYMGNETKVDAEINEASVSSGVDFIERLKDEDLVRSEEGCDEKLEELEQRNGDRNVRRGRQLMKRSNMLAKQVISIQSALSLGFVSQLWVDTVSWVVLVVEVRPNLLSGESETFFLEDVSQVGDVVLIPDESVLENDFHMVGLETLVGYNVVTAGRQSIGKVRGYTFNLNSGAVESLELDSFGVSIIPSSLVSTYALLVEDVLEVVSDTVVVHEAAASRIQRLTKGFWGSQRLGKSTDEFGDYSDPEREPVQFDHGGSRLRDHGASRQRSFTSRKFCPKMRESEEDWELPMDYL
ncbi:hypothetical protein RHSIM_Rhsim05G0231700 [Rhododendron simsii]|uniref:PRC-barrel domain-containing protein n=1 Tax=Rhododendron simsii TaxID=118357 RepID=A0A834GZQ4_RHOSS|nr:hypothetical protein RHSIM_Rhsim05G0231700 [Rhododendron simsii]